MLGWIKLKKKPQIIKSSGKNVEKLELSYTAGDNVKCWSQFGKQFGISSKCET